MSTGPKVALATPPAWSLSQGIESLSQDIKVAPSDASIVFATYRSATGSGLFKSTDAGASFINVFPISTNRDVNSIAVSYTNPNNFCIGTYEQGVFCADTEQSELTNNGWVSSNLQGKRVRYITVDPNDDNVYYAGTGDNNLNGGIYKTTDGGQAWTKIGEATYGGKNCLNIVVDKNDSNRILAGSDFNLYASSDSGMSWSVLPINYTNSPATLFDSFSQDLIFSALGSSGVYKSIDNGNSWSPYNVAIENAFIFRMVQDEHGRITAGRRNVPGGVWQTDSLDIDDTWENISDPSWGNRSAWGLDVGGDRIFVAVEGLGIYYADLSPPTPPVSEPDPVVIIPGFGGSWSYKGLVENQPTTNSDWQLLPFFTDSIYGPLISSFEGSGLTKDSNLFVFAYDFRKSIVDSAQSLKQFLDEEVSPKNPGKKINIIAHSMGGLVARQCFEKVDGCAELVNKTATAGSPHFGTLKAYKLWEGGLVDDNNPVTRTVEEIAINALNPFFLTRKDIVQNRFPGVKDLLPIFDYLSGKPYSLMSSLGKNLTLDNLLPTSSGLTDSLMTLSGDNLPTDREFTTAPPNWWETKLGMWTDGKPVSSTTDVGDGTVLRSSSEVPSVTNKSFSVDHTGYFLDGGAIEEIFSFFGLSEPASVSPTPTISSLLTFVIHSPATIAVTDSDGNPVGENLEEKTVFIANPDVSKTYQVHLHGTDTGSYVVEGYLTDNEKSVRNTISGKTTPGHDETIEFTVAGGSVQKVEELSREKLRDSLITRLEQVGHMERAINRIKFGFNGPWWWRWREHDKETEHERFDDDHGNFHRAALLSAYRMIGKRLANETQSSTREILFQAEQDLFSLTLQSDSKIKVSKSRVQRKIDQLERNFSKIKKKPTQVTSLNWLLAGKLIEESKNYLSANEVERAYVLTFLISVLL